MARLLIVLLSVALLCGACGSGDGEASSASRAESEPPIELPEQAATELGVANLEQGDGLSLEPTDTVIVDYVGRSLKTGLVFDSSWQRDQPTAFGLDQVMVGWKEGLAGMNEGGRRQLTIPADKGFGQDPPEDSGIESDDTLVFIVDLHRIVRAPEVVLPDVPATELLVEDLVEGISVPATADSRIKVHYTGVSLSSGLVFDSSWERGEVAEFTFDEAVLQGWRDGLVGMLVGGRRRLVVPPSLAFGAEPPADTGVAENDTLVFVIDLLGVSE